MAKNSVIINNVEFYFHENKAHVIAYYGGDENITIPSTIELNKTAYAVTSIGDSAFSYSDNLKKVILPEGITTIGYGAFFKCTNLVEVTIPNSVTSIGDSAFEECSSLKNVNVPEKCKYQELTFFGTPLESAYCEWFKIN